MINFFRCSELLNQTIFHDRDSVSKRHGFDLIMCHVDNRISQTMVQAFDFNAQISSELGIEIRQGFIKQKHIDISDQRPTNGDSLSLSA